MLSSIATRQQNALLFYNGRYNDKNDFIALEIIDGRVQFSFSLGGVYVTKLTATVNGGISDGQLREINISYLNRVFDPPSLFLGNLIGNLTQFLLLVNFIG